MHVSWSSTGPAILENTGTGPLLLIVGAGMWRTATECVSITASYKRGGRPKMLVHTGRLPSVSPSYCAQHVKEIAPHPLVGPSVTISICQVHQILDS